MMKNFWWTVVLEKISVFTSSYIDHLGCMKQQIWERPWLLEGTWHLLLKSLKDSTMKLKNYCTLKAAWAEMFVGFSPCADV